MAKKVVVLSSLGGHGHITAVSALKEILGEEYELTSIYPINDISFFGQTQVERFYNYFLRHNWMRSIGALTYSFARLFLWVNRKQIEQYIGDNLDIIKPDLVVSVIPFVNREGISATQMRGLNYLLITADNDLRHWCFDLQGVDLSKIEVCIGSDNRFTRPLLISKGVRDEQIHTTGLPLRPKFTQGAIGAQNPPAILMMLGGSGCPSAYDFAQRILELDLPLHLYVTAGKNRQLFAKLRQLASTSNGRLTPLDISADIFEYMRSASLVIIKSGSLSTTEAMALQKPILLDRTRGVLAWEKMNIRIVLAREVGKPFYHIDELETLVPEMLSPEVQHSITRKYTAFLPNQFRQMIPPIVEKLLR